MKKKLSILFGSLLFSNCQSEKSLAENLNKLGTYEIGDNADLLPETAMCYDPGDIVYASGCEACGAENAGLKLPVYAETLLKHMVRNGYDVQIYDICYKCVNQLIRNNGVETDLEKGTELTPDSEYVVFNIRKNDYGLFRKVLLSKKSMGLASYVLSKVANNELDALSKEESDMYKLLTGEP